MDIQAFKDASARLNPLRQMLADVELVASTTANLFQHKNEIEAEIERLREKRAGLLAQIEETRAQLQKVKRAYDKTQVDLQAKQSQAESEYSEKLQAHRKEVERAQQEAQQVIAQAHADARKALEEYARQKQEAEQAVQQAQEYVKAVSERLKDFA